MLNPLRYRGYVYDSETGFYYLQSRYYDPTIGRFISADRLVSIGTGVLGYNMFAYCNNNPVMRSDQSGYGPITEFFIEIGRRISEDSHVFSGLCSVALADGFLPFGDILAVSAATLLLGGYAIDGLIKSISNLGSKAKTESITQEIDLTKAILQTDYNYWSAVLIDNYVTAIEPLTYSEAKEWAASGNNLLCRNHAAAYAIIRFFPSARFEGRHGCESSGYLNHYHMSSMHSNHIWFLGEKYGKNSIFQ